tara:strand:- start:1451 stop:1582 length:132 start_codon:yes stop_codon:yes gene_type:complete
MDKLEKTIFETLSDLKEEQLNLSSESARRLLAKRISKKIKNSL